MCKPHKDDRGKNSFHSQSLQEQKQLLASKKDSVDADDDTDQVCAYCKGEVCTYDNCDCGNECILKDGLLVHVSCSNF